jgi:mono/diheme cytochrome c family protein
VFSVAEVGSGKEYAVSFLFTDPYNGFTIDPSETAYPLAGLPPVQSIVFDPGTPESVLASGQRLFENACGACHAPTTAEEIKAYPSDDAMVSVALGMAVEAAGLSEEEAEEVVRYMLAVRHEV